MGSTAATPHINRKEYFRVFIALAVLTVLEVGVAYLHEHIGQILVGSALILLALAKAWTVGWFFMHLGHEKRTLKLTVALPFIFPALYAFGLIAEASWRLAVG